jgi:serine protease AprX
VWTDYPGEALQNDLDLIIKTADGKERHGNVAPTSSEFDRRNNVEQVVWNDLPAGKLEIIVHAYRILQPQSYALVVRVS